MPEIALHLEFLKCAHNNLLNYHLDTYDYKLDVVEVFCKTFGLYFDNLVAPVKDVELQTKVQTHPIYRFVSVHTVAPCFKLIGMHLQSFAHRNSNGEFILEDDPYHYFKNLVGKAKIAAFTDSNTHEYRFVLLADNEQAYQFNTRQEVINGLNSGTTALNTGIYEICKNAGFDFAGKINASLEE